MTSFKVLCSTWLDLTIFSSIYNLIFLLRMAVAIFYESRECVTNNFQLLSLKEQSHDEAILQAVKISPADIRGP